MLTKVSEKLCSRCKRILPVSEFYPHRRMKSGLQSHCKTCARQWHRERPEYIKRKNKEFDARNPTYKLDRSRLVKFGLSVDELQKLRDSQNGVCAGCMTDLSTAKECVDHSHKTGKVRGLLCNSCNVSIGRLREDAQTLRRLANYLDFHSRAEAEAY